MCLKANLELLEGLDLSLDQAGLLLQQIEQAASNANPESADEALALIGALSRLMGYAVADLKSHAEMARVMETRHLQARTPVPPGSGR